MIERKLIGSALLCLFFLGGMAQEQRYNGYPSREGNIDIKENFADPPKGYGNIPFYWWNGDSLNRERLQEQLQILSEASTDGFSVSYIHSHPLVDVKLNSNGYGGFGKADPGTPGVFTDRWWETWNWFSGKCADAGVGLGLDDYVLGWTKNGYYVDEIWNDTRFANYQGRLRLEQYVVKPSAILNIQLPQKTISVIAYPDKIDLTDKISDNRLTWKSPSAKEQRVYIVYTQPSCELHPDYGKKLVNVYFNRFEEKLDTHGRKGMNFFFQDELHYDLSMHSWAEDMPEEFMKRKGYSILPYLPALFENIGDITPKIRLDYAEVVTHLSEERYFKPIFDWHNERGLIYGCDNNGRGLEPLQYLDYFRMISWFTAPGNDAPAKGSSFRQTKVSNSITHLYQRPRTWLEAFHSMGWDSNGEWLTSQLEHHMIAGGNLLCLHGLYYSTHGGWWEWAPPCFHFRMPYWPHMKKWLKYAERLSFLLSQGVHVCDIAVLYPTESMQAYPDANPDVMWNVTDQLSEVGLDYDYIDFHSLQKAEIENGSLSVSGEKYKVLILPDTKALHHETLLKIFEFYQRGGIVIATGSLPKATSKSGENNADVERILNEIFKSSTKSGKGMFEEDNKKIPELISRLIVPDFKVSTEKGKVLHRKIGVRDVYMIMNIEKGSELFFRSKGKVERWNAKNATIVSQPILRQTDEGSWIKFDGEYNVAQLIVFSPGIPTYENESSEKWFVSNTQQVEGDWNIEIIPTMNNKWGDFRLPAIDELIGPEAREFTYYYSPVSTKYQSTPVFPADSPTGVFGYAPYMETVTLDQSVDLHAYLLENNFQTDWKPYCFSWQYGVFDNPGGQGYHGLKGKVDNRMLILDQGGHQLFKTYVCIAKSGKYRIEQEGENADFLYLDGKLIQDKVVTLKKGLHRLLIAYANTPKGSYVLAEKKSYSVDDRKRGSVVFYKENYPEIKANSPFDSLVATKWYKTEYVPYSIIPSTNGMWLYQFTTAPGTYTMEFTVKGRVNQLWIDGKEVPLKEISVESGKYLLTVKHPNKGVSTIVVSAKPEIGYEGPAFFVEPVKFNCGMGTVSLGNWSDFGALKFFSGGIRYTKEIHFDSDKFGQKVELDLGIVDATCEVNINGDFVDVLMNSPFKLDVTKFLKPGSNKIEVLVYSTLSNHYQTIPSAYRGEPHAGLIGPVKLIGWNMK